jgi:hypothetical protein
MLTNVDHDVLQHEQVGGCDASIAFNAIKEGDDCKGNSINYIVGLDRPKYDETLLPNRACCQVLQRRTIVLHFPPISAPARVYLCDKCIADTAMAAVVNVDQQTTMVADLRGAIRDCSGRGLSVASKW